MSDNPYFFNNYTFRPDFCNNSSNNVFMPLPSQNFSVPPPPLMPGPYHTHQPNPIIDQDFVKQYAKVIPKTSKQNNKKPISITQAKKNLQRLLTAINKAKEKQAYLKHNMKSLGNEEWTKNYQEILNNKLLIENLMMEINDKYLNLMSKALVKRAAKRMRLKKLKSERQIEKQELMRKRQEKSRSIDEKLQEIVDDIAKVKKEEESKIEADAFLKEVLRKKHDAKKYVTKLDALLKLRKARLNTARGRGEEVSESATSKFNEHIGKLSLLWAKKLTLYEREEIGLREKLKSDTKKKEDDLNDKQEGVHSIIRAWRKFLFGDANAMPQKNFAGDLRRFFKVRSDWDQYASEDGSSLPIGWVLPE